MLGEKEIINSIDRALEILLLFQKEGKELGVSEISSRLGLYKSTVFRTLATLENRGFIEKNMENGKYWLGIKLYSLGMLVKEELAIKKISFSAAKELSDKIKEVVHISVLDKNALDYPRHIIIEKIESQQVLSLTPPIGSSAACHSSAVGKCLLAYSENVYLERFQEKYLPIYTERTIGDWNELKKELRKIRNQGFAVDEEELELGLMCIAAPIFNRKKEIIAAISISGPAARIKYGKFEEIVAEVKKAGEKISSLI